MSEDIQIKIKYARTFLLLVNPFFGTLVINIPIKEVKGPGFEAWTDGKCIKFNEDYVKTISREEFLAVLLHQVLHVAFQHKRRGQGMDHRIAWNKACDEVVNSIVASNSSNMSSKIKMPSNFKIDNRFKKKSAEHIYEILKKEISNALPINLTMALDLFIENAENLNDLHYAEMNTLLIRAENAARMKGTIPIGIDREFEFLLHPKVDWRIMLKEFLQSFPNDWDFGNRDRRFINSQFYMPSLNGDKIQIAIAIDTSGSISEKEVSEFMTECYSILTAFSRVEIILMCCDAEVHSVKKVTSLQEATTFEIKGGGGTDFRPVFKELQNHYSDFDALIFFTDGHGTFPTEASGYKVLWIMTSDVKAPFGINIMY